ncbi:MAG: hypothetical protein F4X40_03720 [Chloroflexi bacterium]|nr:hypothetical protein [Chloroflexota bacterium]
MFKLHITVGFQQATWAKITSLFFVDSKELLRFGRREKIQNDLQLPAHPIPIEIDAHQMSHW